MFADHWELTMTGGEATISFAWHTAAVLTSWRVYQRAKGHWSLVADVARADPFQLRQRPLLFNAPRIGGHWCWPVQAVTLEAHKLTAALGPPEV
jgi:hypothetical protein